MPITDITDDELLAMGWESVDTVILPAECPGSYRPRLFVSKAQRAAMLTEAQARLGPDAHWHYEPIAQAMEYQQAREHFYPPEWYTMIHVNRDRCPAGIVEYDDDAGTSSEPDTM